MSAFHFSREIGSGEQVTLHTFVGDVPLDAIVRLPDQFHEISQGTASVIRGDVLLTADQTTTNPLHAITIRGKTFQVESVAPPIDGHIKITVVREERSQTNTAGLDRI